MNKTQQIIASNGMTTIIRVFSVHLHTISSCHLQVQSEKTVVLTLFVEITMRTCFLSSAKQ